MNWLAHILVSKKSIDYQLGNLLADPLKGKVWPGSNSLVHDGFKMHGNIDAFTDSNEHVQKSKSRLGKKGYLKGVVIDIAYDYLLMKNWEKYTNINVESFINQFYRNSEQKITSYPKEARDFVERIIKYNVLSRYSTFEGLQAAFKHIDNRLSSRILAKETTSGYLPVLESQINAIEIDFNYFFPQLVSHFKSKSGFAIHEHWLK